MTNYCFKDNVNKEIKPINNGYELWVYLNVVIDAETDNPLIDDVTGNIVYEHSVKYYADVVHVIIYQNGVRVDDKFIENPYVIEIE